MNIIVCKNGFKDCLECDTIRICDNILELIENIEYEFKCEDVNSIYHGMLPQFDCRRVVAQINVNQIDYWYVEEINPFK